MPRRGAGGCHQFAPRPIFGLYAAGIAAATVAFGQLDPGNVISDPWFYWQMADRAGPTVLEARQYAPFYWRVGAPWVASLFWSNAAGFAAVTVTSLVGYVWAAGGIFARLGLDRRTGWFCAVFSAATVFCVARPVGTDAPGLAFCALALCAALDRRWWWFAAAVAVGVAFRETVLFAAVPAVFLADRRWKPVLAVLPAVAVLYVIRRTGLVWGVVLPERGALSVIGWRIHNDGGPARAVATAVVAGLGPMVVLAAAGWRAASAQTRRLAVILIPLAGSCVFASDWTRILASAGVVVAALAATQPGVRTAAVGGAVVAVAYLAGAPLWALGLTAAGGLALPRSTRRSLRPGSQLLDRGSVR